MFYDVLVFLIDFADLASFTWGCPSLKDVFYVSEDATLDLDILRGIPPWGAPMDFEREPSASATEAIQVPSETTTLWLYRQQILFFHIWRSDW